ncbi:hypothetical protein [Frateuria terrea]|uniref:Uncharacterized protein n=1 Tax=Frateuria terrea TaxID=529704 RepID=A0A1H6ZPU2_9GAMM|nr:hypothetical protein [Frateuria terrea]SEJ54686.1 hypothetical protein SAMN04487997_0166 [Frateuria terrea]SFP47741.1 hypothetical protein SAMN02927913_2224 [Frateuria terrea]
MTDQLNFVTLLGRAQAQVEASPLWRRFIDGTPLANDIAVWMANFALEAALSAEPAAQGDGEAVADECRHDWVDYVKEEYKPRHRVLELGESNIERYVRIGLMCTTCGAEKPAPPAQPAELTTDAQKIQWRIAYLEHGQWSKLPDGLYRVKHESPGTTVLTRTEEPAERVPEITEGHVRVFLDCQDADPADGEESQVYHGLMAVRDAMLAASPAPSEGGKGVECRHKWASRLGPENAGKRCDWCGEVRP